MINVNMTDKAGVTLATAGKYCADNVKVTPSADILRKDEQAKTATPTTSAQDITPDAGKALSKVTVNPITAAIVGNLDASSFAASIVAAIEGKGVTVPDGTLLDGMAALVEAIQGGSGNIETITFTPADTGNLLFDFDTNGIPFAVVCVRNSFVSGETDTYYYEENEVPMCCILIGDYKDDGSQFPFHVYNSSTSYFSGKVYTQGSNSVHSNSSANRYSVALMRYSNDHPKLCVYVNSTGSRGLRVGETYTAICLFRS